MIIIIVLLYLESFLNWETFRSSLLSVGVSSMTTVGRNRIQFEWNHFDPKPLHPNDNVGRMPNAFHVADLVLDYALNNTRWRWLSDEFVLSEDEAINSSCSNHWTMIILIKYEILNMEIVTMSYSIQISWINCKKCLEKISLGQSEFQLMRWLKNNSMFFTRNKLMSHSSLVESNWIE